MDGGARVKSGAAVVLSALLYLQGLWEIMSSVA
jgi:hypothetical protein